MAAAASGSKRRLIDPIIQEEEAHARALRGRAGEIPRGVAGQARNHAERQKAAAEVIARYEAIRDLALADVPVDARLTGLLEGTRTLLSCDVGAVLLMDDEGKELIPRAVSGFHTPSALHPLPINGNIRQIIRTERPHITGRVTQDDVFRYGMQEEGIQSIVAVPMNVSNHACGVLVCGDRSPDRFTDPDVELLQLVADRMMVGLERSRVFEKERAQRERAEQASQFHASLLHMATHDVKTPLSVLSLHLEVVAREGVSPAQRSKSLEIMQRSVQRVTRMLNDFLDLAKADAQRLVLQPKRADLAKVIRESAEAFQEYARQKDIQLALEVPPNLESVCDGERVGQVVANLTSNALRYSLPGGRVQVNAKRLPDAIEIKVADQGRGLTPAQLKRLFQPFVQVLGVPEEAEGTGLGLYLSKAIVEAHGGSLVLTSPGPGKGTTAFLRIPDAKRPSGGVSRDGSAE